MPTNPCYDWVYEVSIFRKPAVSPKNERKELP